MDYLNETISNEIYDLSEKIVDLIDMMPESEKKERLIDKVVSISDKLEKIHYKCYELEKDNKNNSVLRDNILLIDLTLVLLLVITNKRYRFEKI